MALNLQIQALTVPSGTEFPGTFQENLDLSVAHMEIVGDENFSGVAYGDTEPEPAQRDLAWDKRDGSGNPLGWYGWDGAEWVPFPNIVKTGGTADRPVSPPEGTQYADTDIDVVLIYLNSAWVTVSGSPGDIKQVAGTDLASVLTKNPGWSHYTAGIGRVLSGAAADGSDAETDVGVNDVVLTENQMPIHTHEDIILTGSDADNGDPGNLVITAATANIGQRTITNSQTGPKGGGEGFSVVQQTRIVFMLIKD